MRRTTTVLGLVLLVAVLLPGVTAAEDETVVLVYSRTEGFRHLSIPDGIRTIRQLGQEHGFAVEATEDPAVFTDESLDRFDAVVFLNTTGDVVPDEGQAAFERYVRSGGGWVGVHSAADTEYQWDFYGQLLGGAWFLAHPVQQPGVVVTEDRHHPATAHLPDRWRIPLEEFYSFRASPRDRVHVLLSIDESTYRQDPNTTHLPNSPTFPQGETGTMGDHPMSWCREVGAGRAWYSALGHESYLYLLPDYRQHLLGGILTAAGEVEADCGARRGPSSRPAEGAAAPGPGPTASPPPAVTEPAPPPGAGGVGPAALPATGGAPVGLAVVGMVMALAMARRTTRRT